MANVHIYHGYGEKPRPEAEVIPTVTEWLDEWETDDYPSGRSRVGAKWYTKSLRGGKRTVGRKTESTRRPGVWMSEKTLSPGLDAAKLGYSQEEDRVYLFMYDDIGRRTIIYDGAMRSIASVTYEAGDNEDPYGFRAVLRAELQKTGGGRLGHELSKPKPKPPSGKKRGESFLGKKEDDGTRPEVRGKVIGEWGVYKREAYFTTYRVVHIPTGYYATHEETQKIALYRARRLNQYVPPIGDRDLTEEEMRTVSELSNDYIRVTHVANNGTLKDGYEEKPGPTNKITNRRPGDDDIANTYEQQARDIKYLHESDAKSTAGILETMAKALRTGEHRGKIAKPQEMQAMRTFSDNGSVAALRVKALLTMRKEYGHNPGDGVTVKILGRVHRAVMVNRGKVNSALGLKSSGAEFIMVFPNSEILPTATVSSLFVDDVMSFVGDGLDDLSSTTAELYRDVILTQGKPDENILRNIPLRVQYNVHTELFTQVANEMKVEGLLESRDGAAGYFFTGEAVEEAVGEKIIVFIKNTMEMIPDAWGIPYQYVWGKFRRLGEELLAHHLDRLVAKARLEKRIEKDSNGKDEANYRPLSDAERKKLREGSSDLPEHLHEQDGHKYADTYVLNAVKTFWPESSVKSLGFGEFYVVTPYGEVDFDSMRGVDYVGKSGRSHKITSDKPQALEEFWKRAIKYLRDQQTPKPDLEPERGRNLTPNDVAKGTGRTQVFRIQVAYGHNERAGGTEVEVRPHESKPATYYVAITGNRMPRKQIAMIEYVDPATAERIKVYNRKGTELLYIATWDEEEQDFVENVDNMGQDESVTGVQSQMLHVHYSKVGRDVHVEQMSNGRWLVHFKSHNVSIDDRIGPFYLEFSAAREVRVFERLNGRKSDMTLYWQSWDKGFSSDPGAVESDMRNEAVLPQSRMQDPEYRENHELMLLKHFTAVGGRDVEAGHLEDGLYRVKYLKAGRIVRYVRFPSPTSILQYRSPSAKTPMIEGEQFWRGALGKFSGKTPAVDRTLPPSLMDLKTPSLIGRLGVKNVMDNVALAEEMFG